MAKPKNTLGKVLATVPLAAGAAFASLALSGQLADGDTVTIDGTTYEADDDASVTAGNVSVDITSNASAADDVDDLVTAILANQGDDFRVDDQGDELIIISRDGAPIAVAETAANAAWTSYDGTDPEEKANLPAIQSRAAVAAEVTNGYVPFVLGGTPTAVIPQVRTAAGAVKAWDGVLTIDGELVTLDNSGTTDIAATDVVTILAAFN